MRKFWMSQQPLDARAEYEVFQRFAELTKGKSAVLISHRFLPPVLQIEF
jgi:ABC-type transport system involved in cytochrome bd biosynthesis fused ATPase/permease subunit